MSTTATQPLVTSGKVRTFAILTGLTSLAIFVQAITAGQFVSQSHKHSWIDAHSMIANVAVVLALATGIFAVVAIRKASPVLMWLTVVLFVLTVFQTIIGHLITEGHIDGWIGVHVPLAFIIFGLTAWLSFRASSLRKRV
jgi:heme A synthase